MRIYVLASILIMTLAEISFMLKLAKIGLTLHIINIFYIIILSIFRKAKDCTVLLPPSILRIVNVSMPILFPLTIYWIPLVYISVIPALYFVVRTLEIPADMLGFSFRYWYLIPLMFIIGVIFGVIEFKVANPNPIVPDLSIRNLLVLCIVMYIFVGFTEEFMFRSVIQTRFEEIFGKKIGLLLASIVFGVMHLKAFVFTLLAGIVIGFIFQKTRSLPCIVAIHGTSCVIAYLLPMGIRLPTF